MREALRQILEWLPEARGVVFDRYDVLAAIPPEARLGGRIEVQDGSFFDRVPEGADIYPCLSRGADSALPRAISTPRSSTQQRHQRQRAASRNRSGHAELGFPRRCRRRSNSEGRPAVREEKCRGQLSSAADLRQGKGERRQAVKPILPMAEGFTRAACLRLRADNVHAGMLHRKPIAANARAQLGHEDSGSY